MAKATSPIEEVDLFTGYPVGVTGDHTYIHQGKGFMLAGVSTSIAASGTYVVALTTPALETGKYIHMRPVGMASSANTLQMRLAEGSVISGGNAATPRNKNRNSKRSSSVTCLTAVTLTTEGTILEYSQAGSGSNAGNAQGGSADASANEWVLKPGTTYTLRFENVGATTATVASFNVFWYEEQAGS
jgi:hypothetical protein